MSSAMRDHKIVRRMKNLPGRITSGISRAMGYVTSSVGIGRRRRIRNQHTNSPLQPQVLPQVPEEWDFLLFSFEKQYGMEHPFFRACSFKEVAKLAEEEQKLMFVYLHSPDQPLADIFREKTQCSELVTKLLDENFVCWGAYADRGEGLQMASTLLPSSFPCCAVINPSHSFGITVLQQQEGPLSPPELVEILQRSLEKQGMAIGSDKVKQEEKIQADRRLREEQDTEYHAALQKDQEKVKLKSLLSRERAQKPVEALNTRNEEKLRNNSVKVSKQHNKTNASTNEKQAPFAMRGIESEATQKGISFPNGEMREHTFLCTDKIMEEEDAVDVSSSNVCWSWKGPKRIQTFLWLAYNNYLLTNSERLIHRHLSDNSMCPRCNEKNEDTIHMLRDCRWSRELWGEIVPRTQWAEFVAAPLQCWLSRNLMNTEQVQNLVWRELFGVMCWLIWKARNKLVLENKSSSQQSVIRGAKIFVAQINEAHRIFSVLGLLKDTKVERLICCKFPNVGWCKMNVDGSSCDGGLKSSCGGLLRDDSGRWMYGFCRNLGAGPSSRAELCAFLHGIELAWEAGVRHLLVEGDSQVAIMLITKGCDFHHPLAPLVNKTREHLRRQWTVRFSHTYREGNMIADYLAAMGYGFPDWDLHVLHEPTSDCNVLFRRDWLGVSSPRLCNVL